LSRYQYAKHKWIVHEGLSEKLWPLKAQLDTLTQCFANSFILACPVLLAASNREPFFHVLEFIGLGLWVFAWVLENMADGQKIIFLKDCKILATKNKTNPEKKEELKKVVLGYEPFDTNRYWLWTRCRHPNYFFEWLAWVGFAVIGFGSVATKDKWLEGGTGRVMTFLLSATLLLMVRFFYDCLIYWTGSAPAEQQSVQKRPRYKLYQKDTRVFFPFNVPTWLVDHHCTPRWPLSEIDDQKLKKLK
jgi:steroid 5-alpha reductase family enzyme